MIDYNLEIKTKEELCSWFLAETDWLADCIDGELMQGKRPDNALVKKVRSRLAAYCAYTGIGGDTLSGGNGSCFALF